MPRLVTALIAAFLVVPAAGAAADAPRYPSSLDRVDRVPADPGLPEAHAVDLSGTPAPERIPDLGANPRIPDELQLPERGELHSANHFDEIAVKTEQFQDEHGHVLTLSTDNADVDLTPFANLLASTYHYGEIEFVHVFVTSRARLESPDFCGGAAAACYGADDPSRSLLGAMIVSYEDADIVHGVIHEYGHHMDNATYNLGRLSECGTNGDGSRRWFFAREMEDRILDNLTCDPRGDWGTLLAEVYAEDYAQLVGIPPAEYHPAISVRPPSGRQLSALKQDIDDPFTPQKARKLKGRSSRSATARFTLTTSLPVFVRATRTRGIRTVSLRGCAVRGIDGVFAGRCKGVVKTKRARQRFSFNLNVF
jgi:hypothetical protein